MPQIKVNDVNLYYQDTGKGEETIVFSHGYLMSHKMFSDQIALLSERYRVIAFDHRGHGESEKFKESFGIYDLMEDAAELIDKLVGGPVHFAGMSTGGFVGLRLMVRRPELLKSLVLIDTAAEAEPPEKMKQYNQMLMVVRFFGIRLLLSKTTALLMGEKFLSDPARKDKVNYWRKYISSLDKKAICKFGRAIFDRDSVLEDIKNTDKHKPTLIIVGEKDISTPPEYSREMAKAIPNAQLVTIPDSGHTSPVEEPQAVNKAIEKFLINLG